MRWELPIAAVCAALLVSCGGGPLPGGSEIAEGVYWRLNMLGDGERLPNDSDSVLVRVRAARPGSSPGSVYSTEQWYAMHSAGDAALFFGRMHQGDSATALLHGGEVPWATLGAGTASTGRDTGWVQLELLMRGIRSPEDWRNMERAALWGRGPLDEERILTTYFSKGTGHWDSTMGLWYHLAPKAGAGPRVASGELVTLTYTATFLDNGQVFDRRTEQAGGLTFRLGDPGQVIKGFEVAAHLLPKNGGEGHFVIPSALAFGPKGSSSGIVPPWTPVLYEIQVLPARKIPARDGL